VKSPVHFIWTKPKFQNSEYRQFVEWVKDLANESSFTILADETGSKATWDAKGKKGRYFKTHTPMIQIRKKTTP